MSQRTQYENRSQQRLVKLILILFGDVVRGFAPSQLSKALETDPGNITRDLYNLQATGIASCDEETGLWRLTTRLPQQAIKVYATLDRAQRDLDEARNRFTRTPI